MDSNILARLLALQPQANSPTPALEMFMRGLPPNWTVPIPEFQINSSPHEQGPPRFSGNLQMPALGGSVGLSGEYQPRQFGPPDWSALLRYRREF